MFSSRNRFSTATVLPRMGIVTVLALLATYSSTVAQVANDATHVPDLPTARAAAQNGGTIVARKVRKVGELRAKGGGFFRFKFLRLTIIDPATGRKVKKLLANVNYDAVAELSIPFSGDFPVNSQFEFGKNESFTFFDETINFPSSGEFVVTTTLNFDTVGKWAYSECYGGNRVKTAKVKVQ